MPRDRVESAVRNIEFHLANLVAALFRYCGTAGPTHAASVTRVVKAAIEELR